MRPKPEKQTRREQRQAERTEYLPAPAVLARYGVSDMTLWRWLRDPALAFPQPTIINRRRYFPVSELESWERSRARGAAA